MVYGPFIYMYIHTDYTYITPKGLPWHSLIHRALHMCIDTCVVYICMYRLGFKVEPCYIPSCQIFKVS